MKRFLTAAVLAGLFVSAAVAAPPGGDSAVSQTGPQNCKEQRRTMGMADFRSLYAPNGTPKAAMDACVAKQAQTTSTEAKNAAKACKAEREKLGAEAFADKYGTNPNKKNAFGKCVSATTGDGVEDEQAETLNAAKKCKAERASLGVTAFNAKYGTNPNKRNAFGKCVSKLASASDD
jgi:hypothetical protein